MMSHSQAQSAQAAKRAGRGFSLAWLKPVLEGGLRPRSACSHDGRPRRDGCGDWCSRSIGRSAKSKSAGSFQRVAPVQIEEVVAPFRGAGFLSVDLDALRAALETIPWVDRARVERQLAERRARVHH